MTEVVNADSEECPILMVDACPAPLRHVPISVNQQLESDHLPGATSPTVLYDQRVLLPTVQAMHHTR
jgi:hypothetical protein